VVSTKKTLTAVLIWCTILSRFRVKERENDFFSSGIE
jgi:hypothetical protein